MYEIFGIIHLNVTLLHSKRNNGERIMLQYLMKYIWVKCAPISYGNPIR